MAASPLPASPSWPVSPQPLPPRTEPPSFPRGARSPALARRPLHGRQDPGRLAAAGAVQLGARLVRRRARDGRHGRQDRAEGDRRHASKSAASASSPGNPRRLANGLRGIGAKRGDRLLMMLGATPELWVTMLAAMKLGLVLIPAMPQLGPRRHRRPARARPGEIPDRARRRRREIRGSRSEVRAHRGRRRRRRAGGRSPRSSARTRASCPTGRRRPTTRCCSISPRARRRAQSSSSTPTRAIRSAISRPCTGWASSPATSISTSPRPAGRSTPGRACSRPGTRARRVVALAGQFEPRAALDALVAHGVNTFCAPPDRLAHADPGGPRPGRSACARSNSARANR